MFDTILRKINWILNEKAGVSENNSKESWKQRQFFWRLERDLKENKLQQAISRLEGKMEFIPFNRYYKNMLAELYFRNNDFIKAGKMWYLKSDLNENESKAIQAFLKSVGNDPVLILKKLINKQFFRFHALDDFEILKFKNLLDQVKLKEQILPGFLIGLDNHMKRRIKAYKN